MDIKTIVTHDGGFHADDVFAVATVLLTFPAGTEYRIIRSRDSDFMATADFVLDVGGVYDPLKGRFDHHQTGGSGGYENTIPYASFGLVWKTYGKQICGNADIAESIAEKIVMPIDAIDNGVEICTPTFPGVRSFSISDYLCSYWIDEHQKESDTLVVFEEVVMLAKNLLSRMVEKARHIAEEEKEVLAFYGQSDDKRIIVLPRSMAWEKILVSKPEPQFVIYPSDDQTRFRAKAVRKTLGSFETKVSFPESWAGKVDGDLAEITGVPDAVFCHNKRFLVVAKSLEGVQALVKKALV